VLQCLIRATALCDWITPNCTAGSIATCSAVYALHYTPVHYDVYTQDILIPYIRAYLNWSQWPKRPCSHIFLQSILTYIHQKIFWHRKISEKWWHSTYHDRSQWPKRVCSDPMAPQVDCSFYLWRARSKEQLAAREGQAERDSERRTLWFAQWKPNESTWFAQSPRQREIQKQNPKQKQKQRDRKILWFAE